MSTTTTALPEQPRNLIEYIKSLQSAGNFPRCKLDSVELLSQDQESSCNRPALIDPIECWDPQYAPNPEDIFHALHVCSHSRNAKDFQVLKNGELVEEESRAKAISTAFYQAQCLFIDEHSPARNLWHLEPCHRLQNDLHLVHKKREQFQLKANFASIGAFVDIHVG